MIDVKDRPSTRQNKVAGRYRYSSELVCRAAQITPKTLNNWLGRTPAVVMLSEHERREAGERTRFNFDRDRVLQITLTARLVALGMLPREATLSAGAFTDSGGFYPDFGRRLPSALFKDAVNFLVVSAPGKAKVVPVPPTALAIDLLNPEHGSKLDATIIVNLNELVARVDAIIASDEG